MTADEVWTALGIKRASFYVYKRRGTFDRFQLEPRIGPPRYSRKAVQAYLDGTSTLQPARRR